jgi:hypothetical protein
MDDYLRTLASNVHVVRGDLDTASGNTHLHPFSEYDKDHTYIHTCVLL